VKITKDKLNQIINEEIKRHQVLKEVKKVSLVEGSNPQLLKLMKERFEKLGANYFEALQENDKELAQTLKEELDKIFNDLKI
jgi:septal ring factor EnvC (AmiA/AmiB activator)